MNANVTRRGFVLAGATAASAARVPGANDRIRFGIIGAGGRGGRHMLNLAARKDVEVLAAADVYTVRARRACEKANVKADITQDHRRVLDRKDIDAVVIATADHWHTPIALDALAAGKDIYLEKPMTHRMEEGPRIVKAVRESRRIVQVGTQQISGPHFIEAKQRFFDTGMMGKVSLVRTWWIGNRGYMWKPPADFVYNPQELDWNRFLGPSPKRPFDAQRYFGWYSYRDYSTGQLGGLLVHTADVAYMMLGLRAPLEVVATGGTYQYPEGRDYPDTISTLTKYAENVTITFDCTQSSPRDSVDVEFHGSGGILNIFREGYSFRGPDKSAPPVQVKAEYCDTCHMENFLDCVRSRRNPRADVVYSHNLAAVCHMGNLAFNTGAPVTWNPAWDVQAL